MTRPLVSCLLTLAILSSATAQNDSSAGNDASDKVVAKPVMQWRFDDAKEPGPRAPSIPASPRTTRPCVSSAMAKRR
jgi:hypothetical protein